MGSGASVLSLKQTEGPHRKAGRASVCAARIVPSHTDAIQRVAEKTHTKNGQRQPEIPTAAAIFDEKCVLFEEAPSSATQPIVPAVIAPADPPQTAMRFVSMPTQQTVRYSLVEWIIPRVGSVDDRVPYWGECCFNHRTAALVSSTASRIAIAATKQNLSQTTAHDCVSAGGTHLPVRARMRWLQVCSRC